MDQEIQRQQVFQPDFILAVQVGPFNLPDGMVQDKWDIFRQVLPRKVNFHDHRSLTAWAYCNNNAADWVQAFCRMSVRANGATYLFICTDGNPREPNQPATPFSSWSETKEGEYKPIDASDSLTGAARGEIGYALVFEELHENDPIGWRTLNEDNRCTISRNRDGDIGELQYIEFSFNNYIDYRDPPKNLATFGRSCHVPLLRRVQNIPNGYQTMNTRRVSFVFRMSKPYAVYLKR